MSNRKKYADLSEDQKANMAVACKTWTDKKLRDGCKRMVVWLSPEEYQSLKSTADDLKQPMTEVVRHQLSNPVSSESQRTLPVIKNSENPYAVQFTQEEFEDFQRKANGIQMELEDLIRIGIDSVFDNYNK